MSAVIRNQMPAVRDVRVDPELASISVLDAALKACRASLIAEHPDAERARPLEAQPLMVVLANLIVARTDELQMLLEHYELACENFRDHYHLNEPPDPDPDPCF